MRRRDRADSADTNADSLTAEQAAAELGVSARTVQRYISAGALSGTVRPCRTTRAALRAYQARQEGLAGRIGPAADTTADTADTADTWAGRRASGVRRQVADTADIAALDAGTRADTVGADAERCPACVPLAFVERLLADLRHLEREVGRLEAELAHARRQASERRTSNVERRGGAQRGGVWGRVGLWLRRRS